MTVLTCDYIHQYIHTIISLVENGEIVSFVRSRMLFWLGASRIYFCSVMCFVLSKIKECLVVLMSNGSNFFCVCLCCYTSNWQIYVCDGCKCEVGVAVDVIVLVVAVVWSDEKLQLCEVGSFCVHVHYQWHMCVCNLPQPDHESDSFSPAGILLTWASGHYRQSRGLLSGPSSPHITYLLLKGGQ